MSFQYVPFEIYLFFLARTFKRQARFESGAKSSNNRKNNAIKFQNDLISL